MVVRVFTFICVATLVVLLAGPAAAERRVALVIGNSNYAKVPKLANPTNDAAAIDALLKAASFDKVVRAEDLGAAQLRRALRDFTDEAKDADIAVVFYAGHGMEMNGNNYLIPVDAALERDVDVEDETISLERVSQAIEGARRLKLIILDACRDNPFTRSIKRTIPSRSFGRGLARVDVSSSDTLVAYAARAGSTALDGDEKNSPYTRALLTHLTAPGLDVRLALGRVRDDVMRMTARKQEPFVYGSLGGAEQSLSPKVGTISPTQSVSFGVTTLADLTDRVAPAVVKVRTRKEPNQALPFAELPADHPLNKFFLSVPRGSSGPTGVGFFVSEDGYIVTSHSVIAGSHSFDVENHLGDVLSAVLIGSDAATDVAVLKVKSSMPVPFVRFASVRPFIDQLALLIGSVWHLDQSARSVTLKAWHRAGRTFDNIEFSGSVTGGDLGAPIFNLEGEVQGVAFAVLSGPGRGIGYATPGPIVAHVVKQLMNSGAAADSEQLIGVLARGLQGGTRPARFPIIAIPTQTSHATRSAVVVIKSGSRRGLGVIISQDGRIVTSASLINHANRTGIGRISILRHDNTEQEVQLIGLDGMTDLALLQPPGTVSVVTPEFARFTLKTPRRGDIVFAWSVDFSGRAALRTGIISALGRNLTDEDDFLQSDLQDGTEDTGGPWFNIDGELTGIGTALKISRLPSTLAGHYVGASFAAPAPLVERVVRELNEAGSVYRGGMGVKVQSIDEDIAASLGLPAARGVLVSEIVTDGPAASGGLRSQDAILTIDGKEIRDAKHFLRTIRVLRPGIVVQVSFLRAGTKMTLPVTIRPSRND